MVSRLILMFDAVIGVAMMEPVRVELAFTCHQAKYIKALPLHRLQELVSESGDEVFFRLFVAPNYELVQRIRRFLQLQLIIRSERV